MNRRRGPASFPRALALAAALTAGALRAEPAAPPLPPDFAVMASVQYAHTEIYYHTPAGITPVLANTREIAPGQRLDLVVVVSRYAQDPEGRAEVSYDLAVHYPNGRTETHAGTTVVPKTVVLAPHIILFPREITAFITAPTDPFGDYRFEITVHDRVSGLNATKSVVVRVADSNRPLPLPEKFDASDWLAQYYLRPEPRLALPALEAVSKNDAIMQKGVSGMGALLGFYSQVLADNPWLLPWFKQWLVAADEGNARHLLALVLAYAERTQPGMNADLPTHSRIVLAAAAKELFPAPSATPESGAQLDALWGQFFASGRFEPVDRLVGVVGTYLPYQGKIDEFRQQAHAGEAPPPEVVKSALLGAALWSHRLNAYQYKLVHDYLLYLQRRPATPPPVQAALTAVLAWKPGKL